VHQPLVGDRAVLDPVLVVDLAGPDLEAAAAEFVQRPHPFDRVLLGPLFDRELVEAFEGGPRGGEAGAQLLVLLFAAVLADVEAADQRAAGSGPRRRR
jgi:hypothetical protein